MPVVHEVTASVPEGKLKVLIVEDDPVSVDLLKKSLRKFCREILVAEEGSKALTICHQNPDADLVMMDLQLPGMSGYDTLREMKKISRDMVIIAQTSYALRGDREKSLEAGFNDYIAKPFTSKDIADLLNKHFGVAE